MEQAIQAFGGTSLVVSHDRYFLDKITTRIVEMEHGKLTEYLGNYSYYKEKKLDLEAFEKDRNGEETVEEEPAEEKTAPEKEHQKKQEVSAVEKGKAQPCGNGDRPPRSDGQDVHRADEHGSGQLCRSRHRV